ncbi:hypothetical protein GPM19_00645 [Halomonas sp. ZH2S]|uniref:Uncharacterized protein n=1 Tax=Vreelandella zhuhanensis TaxID=2684210 RepID=A0A7X3KQ97_9GAMM|nr:hypothetical protein [Halomonas zhuhanensis]MWJ26727.1 hypothetical protein [Halomonas zhuhanensis]
MARISEKNARFRSKETICNDLARVLSADLSYGTKFAVVSEITWVWSEFDGKHKGCKYWSSKALQSGLPYRELVHEHIVPKKILINSIINDIENSPQKIYGFLQRFCVGVVVTRDEDFLLNAAGLRSKMPENWDGRDPWARYSEVEIRVEKLDT